jgi:hypothetical protein
MLSCCICASASVQSSERIAGTISPLAEEKNSAIDRKSTLVTVRANISDAEVYLNGQYQGLTPCTVKNLVPGTYRLTVQKNGYQERSFYVSVFPGRDSSFYVELAKISGFIVLTGMPDGCTVYADGNVVDAGFPLSAVSPIELGEGFHTITVKKFGYNDFTAQVCVIRRVILPVTVSLTAAPFSLSGFHASRKSFNPQNGGSLGSCVFSFRVTAAGSGTLAVSDMSGTIVYAADFPMFTQWDQSAEWNGRDPYGNPLPDGMYTATVTSGSFTASAYTFIDSSIVFHAADITRSGTGIGTLPAAYMMMDSTAYIGAEVTPVFRTSSAPFYESPVTINAGMTFSPWFELSGGLTVHAGMTDVPLGFSIAAKFGSSRALSDSAEFCYAGIIRYGAVKDTALYPPYGADTGSGFGAGAAFGIDGRSFYTGISAEYIYGTLTGSISGNNAVLRSGLAAEYRPSKKTAVKAWGALCSSFGESTGTVWARAADAGAGISCVLGTSSAVLNIRAGTISYIGGVSYLSGTAGLTYFF